MSTYQRITYKPEGAKRSRTVILKNPKISPTFISGIQVNIEGDEIAPKGTDEVLHIIDRSLVSRQVRLVMDLGYARLVEAQNLFYG